MTEKNDIVKKISDAMAVGSEPTNEDEARNRLARGIAAGLEAVLSQRSQTAVLEVVGDDRFEIDPGANGRVLFRGQIVTVAQALNFIRTENTDKRNDIRLMLERQGEERKELDDRVAKATEQFAGIDGRRLRDLLMRIERAEARNNMVWNTINALVRFGEHMISGDYECFRSIVCGHDSPEAAVKAVQGLMEKDFDCGDYATVIPTQDPLLFLVVGTARAIEEMVQRAKDAGWFGPDSQTRILSYDYGWSRFIINQLVIVSGEEVMDEALKHDKAELERIKNELKTKGSAQVLQPKRTLADEMLAGTGEIVKQKLPEFQRVGQELRDLKSLIANGQLSAAITLANVERVSVAPQDDAKVLPFKHEGPKLGRNDPCPCGSGKKSKVCCNK